MSILNKIMKKLTCDGTWKSCKYISEQLKWHVTIEAKMVCLYNLLDYDYLIKDIGNTSLLALKEFAYKKKELSFELNPILVFLDWPMEKCFSFQPAFQMIFSLLYGIEYFNDYHLMYYLSNSCNLLYSKWFMVFGNKYKLQEIINGELGIYYDKPGESYEKFITNYSSSKHFIVDRYNKLIPCKTDSLRKGNLDVLFQKDASKKYKIGKYWSRAILEKNYAFIKKLLSHKLLIPYTLNYDDAVFNLCIDGNIKILYPFEQRLFRQIQTKNHETIIVIEDTKSTFSGFSEEPTEAIHAVMQYLKKSKAQSIIIVSNEQLSFLASWGIKAEKLILFSTLHPIEKCCGLTGKEAAKYIKKLGVKKVNIYGCNLLSADTFYARKSDVERHLSRMKPTLKEYDNVREYQKFNEDCILLLDELISSEPPAICLPYDQTIEPPDLKYEPGKLTYDRNRKFFKDMCNVLIEEKLNPSETIKVKGYRTELTPAVNTTCGIPAGKKIMDHETFEVDLYKLIKLRKRQYESVQDILKANSKFGAEQLIKISKRSKGFPKIKYFVTGIEIKKRKDSTEENLEIDPSRIMSDYSDLDDSPYS